MDTSHVSSNKVADLVPLLFPLEFPRIREKQLSFSWQLCSRQGRFPNPKPRRICSHEGTDGAGVLVSAGRIQPAGPRGLQHIFATSACADSRPKRCVRPRVHCVLCIEHPSATLSAEPVCDTNRFSFQEYQLVAQLWVSA